MLHPVLAITSDGFSPFPCSLYFTGQNSDHYILNPSYFIVASRNLFQSIPRTRFNACGWQKVSCEKQSENTYCPVAVET